MEGKIVLKEGIYFHTNMLDLDGRFGFTEVRKIKGLFEFDIFDDSLLVYPIFLIPTSQITILAVLFISSGPWRDQGLSQRS